MIQANRADRAAGCIVGLHYHLHQADYWYVPFGRARVVLHDLRVGSATDGATEVVRSRRCPRPARTRTRGVLIPPGVAHGFASLTDMTITYLVDGYYNAADELGVAWDDPQIAADWGLDEPRALRPRRREPEAGRDPRARPTRSGRCAHEAARHRRRRLHRFQLRALVGARAPGRHRRRVRRAHLRGQPREPATGVAARVRARRHRRPRLRGADAARLRDRRDRQLRGRVAQLVRDHEPGRVLPAPTSSARRRCARRCAASASSASTASTTSRRARSTATSRSTRPSRSTSRRRTRPARRTTRRRPAATTRCARTHETFGLPISITNCANNYGPYQFPEKVIPLFATRAIDDQRRSRCTRRRRTGASGSTPTITAARSRASSTTAGSARRTTSAPARNAASRRSPTRVLAALGQAGVAQDDRPRPARSRPALPPRRVQDPRRARLGAARRVRGRAARRPCEWYAANRAWWEPLLERAPVDETAAWK